MPKPMHVNRTNDDEPFGLLPMWQDLIPSPPPPQRTALVAARQLVIDVE